MIIEKIFGSGFRIFLLFFLAFFITFLYGCSSQEKPKTINLEYKKAYQIFADNILQNIKLQSFSGFEITDQELYLSILPSDKQKNIQLLLNLTGNSDQISENYNNSFDLDFFLDDEATNDKLILSGNFEILGTENEEFLKINNFYFDKGKGNTNGEFINLFVQKFLGNWIKLDVQNNLNFLSKISNNFINYLNYGENFGQLLKENNLLENLGKTNYEGYNAYKLGINKNFYPEFFESFDFDGYLVLKDLDDIYLIFEMKKPDMEIFGNFGNNRGNLLIKDLIETQNYNLNLSKLKEKIKLNISVENQDEKDQNILGIFLDIKPIFEKDKISLNINGNMLINMLNLQIQSTEKNMNLKIDSELKFYKTENLNFSKPYNFLLLSQIIGDEYRLENISD